MKYKVALQFDPDNARGYQELAQRLYRLGRYEEAEEASKRALELDPNLAIPHAILGYIRCKKKQYAEGEMELREAIQRDPFLEEAYAALGAALIAQDRIAEAETILKKALELNPKDWITYYNLSLCYARQTQYMQALQEALRAFRIHPSIKTGLGMFLLFLEYVATQHRIMFSLAFAFLIFLSFAFPSLPTLLLFILLAGYLFLGGISNLKSGRQRQGRMLLLLTVILVLLYLIYISTFR